ncbi:hypothetical protein BDB00DRAFT_933532, partial [Zychaea mexicana]|uniref:uncharacterized protein n=1 Tax=Zychaea mexicana TaxID=64656 RepID=UPI0022FF43D4
MRRNWIRARALTDRNGFRLSLSDPDLKRIGRCHSGLIRLIRFISIAILMVSFVIGRLLRNAKESAKLKGRIGGTEFKHFYILHIIKGLKVVVYNQK